MEEETARWQLDNGTPVYAPGELRRRMGTSWDSLMAGMIGAIDRSGSAIIQAENGSTAQDEIRHLVRALAATIQVYALSAALARATLDERLRARR